MINSLQGQGHHTMIAMIVAENLGVAPEDILFESADTSKFPHGVGTIGSRVAANVGPSAFDAASKVREKALKLAAEVAEQAVDSHRHDSVAKGVVSASSDKGGKNAGHVRVYEYLCTYVFVCARVIWLF